MEDTIAAIATPPGMGGIGIIRVSGPKSKDIARLLFRPSTKTDVFKTHHLYHGDIVIPETGRVIDEVLVSLFTKPHSHTGEDTLEINCHGGAVILQTVLTEVIRAGARLAEPGEFTKRAFLNNRIDLSRAEAVFDMITAKTETGLELAVSQFKGNLAGKIGAIHCAVVDILATLEASIDFSDDDVDVMDASGIADTLQSIVHDLHALASTYREGKIFKDGVSAVITGRPNVGKSSLLNRLLGEKRAIVTPVPGTTRDFIEEMINIGGIPVRLTDTAGIRKPENLIEEEGIHLVREKLAAADMVIVVLDGSEALSSDDIKLIKENLTKKLLPVVNKTDLPRVLDDKALKRLLPGEVPPPLEISAKFGDGIPELKDSIRSLVLSGSVDHAPDYIVTNIRHKTAIEKTSTLLIKARDTILAGISPEFAAFDVREALDCLDEITGKTTNEEVLDRIFSTFCIGK
ncbi:MAG: tRNA uridine-5-carboxymethylaminomethyl(34) synthesis GTPase MnmE [Deltaproteobacteria bacterium]|nr:tRNA uridine-5-carboxymethylaminomethyl(34) synthesis GTPase MnmE [Deltaproteobacteria bacterium]